MHLLLKIFPEVIHYVSNELYQGLKNGIFDGFGIINSMKEIPC